MMIITLTRLTLTFRMITLPSRYDVYPLKKDHLLIDILNSQLGTQLQETARLKIIGSGVIRMVKISGVIKRAKLTITASRGRRSTGNSRNFSTASFSIRKV